MHQGEILYGVQEYQPVHSGQPLSPGAAHMDGELFEHRAVVVTPECDLIGDYGARQILQAQSLTAQDRRRCGARLLGHIHLCEVFEEGRIRQLLPEGSKTWDRVKTNQDVRYHKIPEAPIERKPSVSNPDLFLDFKKLFSIPTVFLYQSLKSDGIERRGIIPPPWIDSLIDRLFHFQARVCVPDPDDPREAIGGSDATATARLGEV